MDRILFHTEGVGPIFLFGCSSVTAFSRILAENELTVGLLRVCRNCEPGEWVFVCGSLKPTLGGRSGKSDGGGSVETAPDTVDLWSSMNDFGNFFPVTH